MNNATTPLLPSAQALIQNYSDQLSSRFHSNSMATEVLVSLIIIMMLVVEVVKVIKKTYEWQNQFQINLEQKYVDQSKMVMRETQVDPVDNQNQNQNKPPPTVVEREGPVERERSRKKEVVIPPIIQLEQLIKRVLPQLAIIPINIIMLSSYQQITITAYIAIVLIVISQILGMRDTEHLCLKFVLEIITKLLMLVWYINVLAYAKPSPY